MDNKSNISDIYETKAQPFLKQTAKDYLTYRNTGFIKPKNNHESEKTLLVFNCHEAWVYQLASLGFKLDIITGLKGHYKQTWDYQMRPLPAKARLINLRQAQQSNTNYYCIICHNTTDLLDIKSRSEPKIIVLHSTIEGRIEEENAKVNCKKMHEESGSLF